MRAVLLLSQNLGDKYIKRAYHTLHLLGPESHTLLLDVNGLPHIVPLILKIHNLNFIE